MNQNSNTLLRHICESWNHSNAACSDNQQGIVIGTEETTEVGLVENVGIILITEGIPSCDVQKLDYKNFAVLDLACLSNVCGTKWLDKYLETLTEAEKQIW